MAAANVVVRTVAEVVRAAGYKGRAPTWRRDAPVGIAVVNLQRSQWGPQYYVNFALYVSALPPLTDRTSPDAPGAHQCHFSARAESLDRSRRLHWQAVLDLEHPMDEDERGREVSALLVAHVLPFLDSIGTETGLRAAGARGELNQGLRLALRRYLGLPEPS